MHLLICGRTREVCINVVSIREPLSGMSVCAVMLFTDLVFFGLSIRRVSFITLPAVLAVLDSLHRTSIHDRRKCSTVITAVQSIGVMLAITIPEAHRRWR